VSVPSFADHRAQWAQLPVDDLGYLFAGDLLHLPNPDLRALVAKVERVRYDPHGFRNWRNRWRATLGLDATHNARVLDYGCGLGVEALQYARNGCAIWLADLTPEAIELAVRVLKVHGLDQRLRGTSVIDEHPPFVWFPQTVYDFDVVHMAGVLHHIWQPRPVVERVHRWLVPADRAERGVAGELRLMLYSERAWQIAVGDGGSQPPPEDPTADPRYGRVVRYMDGVGTYADWYSPVRLIERFGDLFHVERCQYLTPDGRFLAAVLRRRDPTSG
jgi:SAM-dependent methyltransferase